MKLSKQHDTFRGSIWLRKYHCKNKYFTSEKHVWMCICLSNRACICQDNLGYDVTTIHILNESLFVLRVLCPSGLTGGLAACFPQSWTHANRALLGLINRTVTVVKRALYWLRKLCRPVTHNRKSKSCGHTSKTTGDYNLPSARKEN